MLVLNTISFGQTTKGLSDITKFLTSIKEKNEFRISQIFRLENNALSGINSDSLDQLTDLKAQIFTEDRELLNLYNLLRTDENKFIIGLETDLLISNKKLSHVNDGLYQTDITNIGNEENKFAALADSIINSVTAPGFTGKTSILPETILPTPLDLFNAIVTLLNGNRDFRTSQIQSLTSVLNDLKMASIADMQSGSSDSGGSGGGDDAKSKSGK
jgi:hypothetical protein